VWSPDFCHKKFRTVVLSYFVAQNRLDWRIIAAIPAIVASGG
jgi:hypothetical protein